MVFEDVAGLAVEGTAEGLEGGEARASIMSMFTIIAMAVSLDGESVFFADSDRKAVDKGECEEYQRSQKH